MCTVEPVDFLPLMMQGLLVGASLKFQSVRKNSFMKDCERSIKTLFKILLFTICQSATCNMKAK